VAVIPTRDRAELLAQAVVGLRKQQLPWPLDLVVVDNGSRETATHAYLQTLAEEPLSFQCIRDERPFNFSALCNGGIAASSASSIVLLLNNDVVFSHPQALAEMLNLTQLETVGCVGALLRYPNGRVQHLGVELSGELVQHQAHGQQLEAGDPLLQHPRQVTALTAACMMFRRSLWDELAGFDEDLPVDFNDVDFCLRAQAAGFANLVTPRAEAIHLESASRGREAHVTFADSLRIMKVRWGKHVGNDPYALDLQSSRGWLVPGGR
jgi:GT2 family glycosyltransferase